MRDRVTEILINETIDTLEKLAFIFAEAADAPDAITGVDLISVSADYSGPYSGRLVMGFAADGLIALAANMLGLDEDDEITDAEQQDALKEALNIICGNVLPAVAGSEAVFNIAAPQLIAGVSAEDAAAARAVARLTMDEGALILYLFCDGDLPH
ncbi:MAG: chemotaxis protein CheX [Pseudomonadota bacterium]